MCSSCLHPRWRHGRRAGMDGGPVGLHAPTFLFGPAATPTRRGHWPHAFAAPTSDRHDPPLPAVRSTPCPRLPPGALPRAHAAHWQDPGRPVRYPSTTCAARMPCQVWMGPHAQLHPPGSPSAFPSKGNFPIEELRASQPPPPTQRPPTEPRCIGPHLRHLAQSFPGAPSRSPRPPRPRPLPMPAVPSL